MTHDESFTTQLIDVNEDSAAKCQDPCLIIGPGYIDPGAPFALPVLGGVGLDMEDPYFRE